MPGTESQIVLTTVGGLVSVGCLTTSSDFSWSETYLTAPSADILGLKFLPVRSEGSYGVLQFLGDFA